MEEHNSILISNSSNNNTIVHYENTESKSKTVTQRKTKSILKQNDEEIDDSNPINSINNQKFKKIQKSKSNTSVVRPNKENSEINNSQNTKEKKVSIKQIKKMQSSLLPTQPIEPLSPRKSQNEDTQEYDYFHRISADQFKDEILLLLKKIEDRIFIRTIEENKNIKNKISSTDDLIDKLTKKYDSLLDEIKVYKQNSYTPHSTEMQNKKIIDMINVNSLKMQKFEKQLNESQYRYDKQFESHLTVPGLIGAFNRFKTVGETLEFCVSNIQSTVNAREKHILEAQEMKNKIDSMYSIFNKRVEQFEKTLKGLMYSKFEYVENSLTYLKNAMNTDFGKFSNETLKLSTKIGLLEDTIDAQFKDMISKLNEHKIRQSDLIRGFESELKDRSEVIEALAKRHENLRLNYRYFKKTVIDGGQLNLNKRRLTLLQSFEEYPLPFESICSLYCNGSKYQYSYRRNQTGILQKKSSSVYSKVSSKTEDENKADKSIISGKDSEGRGINKSDIKRKKKVLMHSNTILGNATPKSTFTGEYRKQLLYQSNDEIHEKCENDSDIEEYLEVKAIGINDNECSSFKDASVEYQADKELEKFDPNKSKPNEDNKQIKNAMVLNKIDQANLKYIKRNSSQGELSKKNSAVDVRNHSKESTKQIKRINKTQSNFSITELKNKSYKDEIDKNINAFLFSDINNNALENKESNGVRMISKGVNTNTNDDSNSRKYTLDNQSKQMQYDTLLEKISKMNKHMTKNEEDMMLIKSNLNNMESFLGSKIEEIMDIIGLKMNESKNLKLNDTDLNRTSDCRPKFNSVISSNKFLPSKTKSTESGFITNDANSPYENRMIKTVYFNYASNIKLNKTTQEKIIDYSCDNTTNERLDLKRPKILDNKSYGFLNLEIADPLGIYKSSNSHMTYNTSGPRNLKEMNINFLTRGKPVNVKAINKDFMLRKVIQTTRDMNEKVMQMNTHY